MNKTIVALSSAQGTGAVAVIRMSGGNAVEIFSKSIKNYENFDFKHSHIKRFTLAGKNNEIIDDVMAAVFFAPKSFTGENVIEIFCHGGQITVERIIKRMIELGAVAAGKGDFTKRAFLNGKIDLHKAEAINAVISAKDYYSHKNAMALYNGEGREFFDEIKNKLQNILVEIESEIEFWETDDLKQESDNREKIKEILTDVSQKISIQKEKYTQLKKIKNGIPVVLVGRTNAGKSSLFNCLFNENRVIVSEKAGTTRDIITETISFNDIVIRLFDTAGFSKSDDEIENEGIKRTKKEIEKALAALWVISPDDSEFKNDYELIKNIPILIAILNKTDLLQNDKQIEFLKKNNIEYLKISALQNFGIQNVVSSLTSQIEKKLPEKSYNTFLTSQREAEIIKNMLEIMNFTDVSQNIEIVAENIRETLKTLNEIYGFLAPDEIINKIFDSFCIGK
ncbi:MAG: tRNA uridine-5-carboxymethylaminomethyl(34) synthesis GTPase MnmE [Chitinispirillales bacterium]|jgi:tRNA modification GTPase|nr:tRNA uridine-5-carboxymethylaminomethyl(34) synthesis GTPase MnmE [Chitinispirillales bacterium]